MTQSKFKSKGAATVYTARLLMSLKLILPLLLLGAAVLIGVLKAIPNTAPPGLIRCQALVVFGASATEAEMSAALESIAGQFEAFISRKEVRTYRVSVRCGSTYDSALAAMRRMPDIETVVGTPPPSEVY